MYNILVVDDEKIHRQGILSLLEEICPGDMFWEAGDGTEAMDILKNIVCEIVISDIRMSKMDGLSLLRRIKELRPETYFIIISGYADFYYAKEAIFFKASAYLLKPVDREELRKVLEEVKEKHRGYRENMCRVSTMEEQLKETVPAYMEWLLNQYISSAQREKWQTLDELLYLQRSGFIMLTRFKTENPMLSEDKKRSIGYSIKKLMEPCSAISFTVSRQPDLLATLVLGEIRPEKKKLIRIAEYMEKTERISSEQIYFSLSGLYENMEKEGKKAYEEAKAAMNYSFYEDKHILQTEELCMKKKENPWEIENLLSTIRKERTEQAVKIFEDMLGKEGKEPMLSPDILKRKVVFLFFQILRNFEPFLEREQLSLFHERNNQIMEISWYGKLVSEGRWFIFQIIRSLQKKRVGEYVNPIQKCKDYLDNHYMEELSLENVAGLFHFNPSYFSAAFKQCFGTSFSQYLSSVRMERAIRLLLESDYKIKEIAGLVGYRDSNYFIRSFKKRYGIAPDEFRKQGE